MRILSKIGVLLILGSFGTSFAQQSAFPTIKIKDAKNEFLRLEKLAISVDVVENIASTTMEMTFFNSTNRILEGELNFPLGQGQTVSRFALDINGTLREGVVVDKEKGTEVFESIIRRGVDPGLLEMTEGNNFKARVYPIPANGYKKIVVAYEQELKSENGKYLYLLPLNFKEPLTDFSVHIEVLNSDIEPLTSNNDLINLKFTKLQSAYISDFAQHNFIANKQLGFSLPKQEKPKNILTFKGKIDSASYFYINSEPKIETKEKIKPSQIAIYYDVSASSKKRNKDKEFALLDSYFKWLGNVKAHIVTFSNEIESNTSYDVTNGNWQSIKTKLQNIVPDGGTQLGALDFNTTPCDEILLFTDGLSNYGKCDIILSQTPVITVNSNVSADHNLLNYLAQKTAGYYLDLNAATTQEAVNSITHQNLQFLFAEYSENEISEVYPNTPTHFTSNFSITGKVRTSQAKITLHFGYGNLTSYTKDYIISNANPIESNLTERIWVQKKIADLSANYQKNKDEITNVGKKFSVVTKTTSLIVLDNPSDYIRYQIVPPAEMQEEYFAQFRKGEIDKKEACNKHLDAIYEQYQEKIKWWKDKPVIKPKIEADPSVRMMSNIQMERPIPPPPVLRNSIRFTPPVIRPDSEVAEEEEVRGDEENIRANRTTSIVLQSWEPKSIYMDGLKKVVKADSYNSYLSYRKEYAQSPSFFLDVATYFYEVGEKKMAIKVLSNLAEMNMQNQEISRILGRKLLEFGEIEYAIAVFKKVLEIRSFEPHSYRDLGLAYAENKEYQKAIETLYQVITKELTSDINSRFSGIESIVLGEMNSIIEKAGSSVDTNFIDNRFLKNLPVDVRIVLNWDADDCDMDLWVIDPKNEKCMYSHNRTQLGGYMSRDMTRGYGPEEFLLRRAADGKYSVEINYFGSRQQTISGPVTLQVLLFTNFGKKNEERKVITVRLTANKEILKIGELMFDSKKLSIDLSGRSSNKSSNNIMLIYLLILTFPIIIVVIRYNRNKRIVK